MSDWNGSHWVEPGARSVPPKPKWANRATTLVMVLGLAALILPLQLTFAGNHSRYQGSLSATPSTLQAGDTFTVSGCGYDRALGNVIVGFTGGSWGSALDTNGCFSIAGIPALSGDTLAAGTYKVSAFQYVRKRLTETGETAVTVVP